MISLIHVIKQEAHNVTSVSKNNASAPAEVKWSTGSLNVEDLVHLDASGNCFIFTSSSAYMASESLRQQLSSRFEIPDWFWSEHYQRSNGSFGCDDVSDIDLVDQHTKIWSRYLVKHVEQNVSLNLHRYEWYEMGLFALSFAPGRTTTICFNTPDRFRLRLLSALNSTSFSIDEPDIYQLHGYVIEQILNLYDESVWDIRQVVRDVEKARSGPLRAEPNFPLLHDFARHAIHVSETLDIATENMSGMVRQYTSRAENRSSQRVIRKAPFARTLQFFYFQLQTFRSLKARSDSNHARLQNEINLAFNLVTQRDSQASIRISEAVRSDSTAMRTVAILTLTFLPATFVSAIFSTSFFDFSPATRTESGGGSWTISDKFWIYWAFSAPLTLATIASWFFWQRWYTAKRGIDKYSEK